MAAILTFLGKGGTGRTTLAIATARSFAQQGRRVLLLSQFPDPSLAVLLPSGSAPLPDNLKVVQLEAAQLLSQNWELVKQLETQYLRTPFFKNVYGQELAVLPGMDYALTLNALREYDASGDYDVIVFDGSGDLTLLRTLGMPEMLNWYTRRFRQVFAESDLGKTLAPFIQPVTAAVLNVSWTGEGPPQPVQQAENLLDKGQATLADPNRVAAYLVTTTDPAAIATAKYLWGSAQQMGLTVAGVLVNQSEPGAVSPEEFAPLNLSSLPKVTPGDWQPLIAALPDFQQASAAPRPLKIDLAEKKVSLFLPGFAKNQVKLSQNGPELTVEAGDQRRNIVLPPELKASPISGAKFQDGYLIISF